MPPSYPSNPGSPQAIDTDMARPHPQQVEKATKKVTLQSCSLPMLSSRRAYVPPPEPSIAAICRDTFLASTTRLEKKHSESASRLQHCRKVARKKERKRAVAWVKLKKDRDERDYKELLLDREAKEKAKLEEQEAANARKSRRKLRWVMVQKRLEQKVEEQEKQAEAARSKSEYEKHHDEVEFEKETHELEELHERNKKLEEALTNEQTHLSADERINLMRKAAAHKKKCDKRVKKEMARKDLFDKLPLERKKMLESVFTIYDKDGSGSLGANELSMCLSEIGFRGQDPEERRLVGKTIKAAMEAHRQAGEEAEIDLYELSANIIPAVCKQLNKIRKDNLKELLSYAVETDEDGHFNFDQLFETVQDIWPFVFESMSDSLVDASGATAAKVKSNLEKCTRRFIKEEIDFNVYTQNVGRICEDGCWDNFALQQAVKVYYNLDNLLFRQFREEITGLDKLFKSVDTDCSGLLDDEEVNRLLKEIGILPSRKQEQQDVLASIKLLVAPKMEELGGVDFLSFLSLIEKSRKMLNLRIQKKLIEVYPEWGKNPSSTININYLNNNLFKDMNIKARSREESRVMHLIIKEADADGDDKYTLKEVQVIVRKVQEQLRQMQLAKEIQVAAEVKFTEDELNQARFAFQQLDDDCSGALDKDETRKAANLLGKEFTNTSFATAFARLDSDRSGSLEFLEFIRFLHYLQTDGKDYEQPVEEYVQEEKKTVNVSALGAKMLNKDLS